MNFLHDLLEHSNTALLLDGCKQPCSSCTDDSRQTERVATELLRGRGRAWGVHSTGRLEWQALLGEGMERKLSLCTSLGARRHKPFYSISFR